MEGVPVRWESGRADPASGDVIFRNLGLLVGLCPCTVTLVSISWLFFPLPFSGRGLAGQMEEE